MSLTQRILLFLLLIVSISASGIWMIGGKKQQYSTSVAISAPPSQVFPYLVESERLKQWGDALVEVGPFQEPSNETGPPLRTDRTVRSENGTQIRFDDQVLRFTQNKLLSVQSTNQTQVITSIFDLEENANFNTQLKYTVKISNVGVGRLLNVFLPFDVENKMISDALRLKQLVEESDPIVLDDPVSSAPVRSTSSDTPETIETIKTGDIN